MAGADNRYSVAVEKTAAGSDVYVLRDTLVGSEARVIPSIGNNWHSFKANVGGSGTREIMRTPAVPEEMADGFNGVFYGNPLLFPFPNRLKNAQFTFEGKTVRLPRVMPDFPHTMHGLVLNAPYSVVGTSVDGGATLTSVIRWEDTPTLKELWPFPFHFTVTYTLNGNKVRMECVARNTGSGRMPMGFGIHGYTLMPIDANGKRGDCKLKIPARRQWAVDSDLIPLGYKKDTPAERDFQQLRPIGDLTLDDLYTDVVRENGWSECVMADPAAGIEMAVRADEEFREIVVWAPPHLSIVCFEPYTCATDAMNMQPQGVDAGLIVLEPGAEWKGVMEFEARPISR
jgi:aldose 1-epimerase